MRIKYFKALRWEMLQHDVDVKLLARRLLRSESYIRARLNAESPWELDECYKILDMLRVPHERFVEMFPPVELKKGA